MNGAPGTPRIILRMIPVNPQNASAALVLVNSAVTAVKSAFELSKKTSDVELKHQISAVMDSILDLKVKVIELDEENRELRSRLREKDKIVRSGPFGYWFKQGEADPLCPKCYEQSSATIYLSAPEPWSGGIRRDCKVCSFVSWEQPMSHRSGQIRSYDPYTRL